MTEHPAESTTSTSLHVTMERHDGVLEICLPWYRPVHLVYLVPVAGWWYIADSWIDAVRVPPGTRDTLETRRQGASLRLIAEGPPVRGEEPASQPSEQRAASMAAAGGAIVFDALEAPSERGCRSRRREGRRWQLVCIAGVTGDLVAPAGPHLARTGGRSQSGA